MRGLMIAAGAALMLCLLPASGGAMTAAGDGARPAAAAVAEGKRCRKGYVKKRVWVGKGERRRRVTRCVRRRGAAPKPGQPPAQQGQPGPPSGGGQPGAGHTAIPPAQFVERLRGARIERVYANTTSSGSSQGTDRYYFCADGQSFQFTSEYIGYTGNAYFDQYAGTYQVTQAVQANDGSFMDGRLTYQWNNPKQPQGEVIVRITARGPAYVGNADGYQEFAYQPGQANC